MKKIYFDNINTHRWFWVPVLVLSLVLILVNFFEVFEFNNPNINTILSCLGFSIQVIYFSKMFWFKNFVQWNNKGIVIKTSTLSGKSFSFDNIKTVSLKNKTLILVKTDDEHFDIEFKDVVLSDIEKLKELIEEKITP